MVDSRDSLSPYGVLDFLSWNHAWNNSHYSGDQLDRTLALMQDAGVGIVRFDFLWSDIEPAEGQIQFEKYDRLMEKINATSIKVLGILGYAPPWLGDWNQSPPPAQYANYCAKVVDRYKGMVRSWEVWNEPDHEIYFQPQDHLKTYFELLKQARAAIRSSDTTARVLLGGLSQALPNALKDLYALGARDFFDVINIHPFVNPLMPDALGGLKYLFDTVRLLMEKNQDGNKPIWITELGCPGMTNPKSSPTWWLGSNTTEIHQAAWVRLVLQQIPKWKGVEKIFWAFFRDTNDHFKTAVDSFGLIRQDFSKKPAFDVYQEIARAK